MKWQHHIQSFWYTNAEHSAHPDYIKATHRIGCYYFNVMKKCCITCYGIIKQIIGKASFMRPSIIDVPW